MPEPDYGIGDEVEYIGPECWLDLIDDGPHFCTDMFEPADGNRCITHYERHLVVEITGTHRSLCGERWCALNWQRRKTKEVEYGQYVSRILRHEPSEFESDPLQEAALRRIAEFYGLLP